MLRRPPIEGRGSSQQQKLFLAFAVILLPWIQLTNAQQQRQPLHQAAHSIISPHAAADVDVDARENRKQAREEAATIAASHASRSGPAQWENTPISAVSAATIETSSSGDRKRSPLREQNKNIYQHHQEKPHQQHARRSLKKNSHHDNILIPDDASAPATLAPDNSVRAPSPPRRQRQQPSSASTSGLTTSQQYARSLEDWEVEDFVLLATIDGDLYANDRRTGKQLWHLQVVQPMVETIHYRGNTSVLDDDHDAVDHYVWAIEPNRDGGVYVWVPEPGARPRFTGFTMKELVEDLSPYAGEEPGPAVVYVGDKRTTMVTLDAATGNILKWFGTGGSHVNQAESCLKPNALYDTDAEECSTTGTITLGRTEYTVGIERRDGKPIATLKYAEWTPNNRDKDLFHQYHVSKDNRYISTQHDGKVYSFDYARSDSDSMPTRLFSQKFDVPVARVFDVCRPSDAAPGSNPDLILLSQPTMPTPDDRTSNSIFLNRTEAGSWYALSGSSYPLIHVAPEAQASLPDGWERMDKWDTMTEAKLSKLVGTHSLGSRPATQQFPRLTDGSSVGGGREDPDNESVLHDNQNSEANESTIVDKVKNIPQSAATSVYEFISNPVLIIFIFGLLVYNRKNFTRAYQLYLNGSSTKDALSYLLPGAVSDANTANKDRDSSELSVKGPVETGVDDNSTDTEKPGVDMKALGHKTGDEGVAQPDLDTPANNDGSSKPGALSSKLLAGEEKVSISDEIETKSVAPSPAPEGKKKKAHRGRRGGVKHRKGRPRDSSQSREDEPANATVEEAVSNAKKLGDRPVWEPDVLTVANDMQAVSGPIIRMGNIEVNLEEQLGTGSNGTLVFAGKFDGRDVAVKRMLIQFYDIASQETRLLRESDDHPNG